MAASVDGRTRPSRWRPERKDAVGPLYEQTHEQLVGDAWLIGRVTGQEFARGAPPLPAAAGVGLSREAWWSQPDAGIHAVVLDPHGKIVWGRSEIGGDPIVVVLSEAVSDAHLAGLRRDGVSYFFAGKSDLDLSLTLEILYRELNVRRLLLEGGGAVNGSFLDAGLIDELSLIVLPAVDSMPGAVSVFDSRQPARESRAVLDAMTLLDHQLLGQGALWLRYRLQYR